MIFIKYYKLGSFFFQRQVFRSLMFYLCIYFSVLTAKPGTRDHLPVTWKLQYLNTRFSYSKYELVVNPGFYAISDHVTRRIVIPLLSILV